MILSELRSALRVSVADAEAQMLEQPAIASDIAMFYALSLAQTADAILTSMDEIEHVHGTVKPDAQALANMVTPLAEATLQEKRLAQPREEKILALYDEAQKAVLGENDGVIFRLQDKPEISARINNLMEAMDKLDMANDRAWLQHEISDIRVQTIRDYFKDNVKTVNSKAFIAPPAEIYPPLIRAKAAQILALEYEANEKDGIRQDIEKEFMKVPDELALGTDYIPGFLLVAQSSYRTAATLFTDAGKPELAEQTLMVAGQLPVTDEQAAGYNPDNFVKELVSSRIFLTNQVNTLLDPYGVRFAPYYTTPVEWIQSIEKLGRDASSPVVSLPVTPVSAVTPQTPTP